MFANKLKLTAAAAALALAGVAGSAQAAPIDPGSGFAIGAGLTGSIANQFDFLTNTNGVLAVSTSGSYAGLLTIGSVKDIPSFTSFAPITAFLDFGGGLTVDLNSITSVTHTSGSTGTATKVTGGATCNIPGRDPTTCSVILTGNNNPAGTSPTVSGSVSVGGTAVPEPASAALLGGALLGLGAIRRRKQQQR
ncbi:VPLPA-CTERM sorting domain-containing protein [Roseiterribacter gracilis]|uniref:Ice-binding protein C-terminal domain-containing protein n=1 Tax=Roseiterribacter gracilis TaxID=2812848 RepID=A0A8S8XIL2_9PROT|nr:hypothetical protein TMPK1_40890 [Rhodospirillales bacterium TMPK1]